MKEEKKIFVTKATLPPKEEFLKYVDKIWESAWLTNMGDVHNELENTLSKFMDDMDIVLTVNSKDRRRSYYNSIYLCLYNSCHSKKRAKACFL